MFTGEYPYLRCCDQNKIIGLGIQFRHGLDSQYGEIKLIMKPGFEKGKKGVSVDSSYHHEPKFQPYPNYFKFYENQSYTGEKLQKQMDSEARMKKRSPRSAKFSSKDPSYPYGPQCVGKEKNYSWCNIQLHLGSDVPFTDVAAVLVPRFLLYLPEEHFSFHGLPIHEILYLVHYSKVLHGKPNPFYHKLHFVGPKNYNDYYAYIEPIGMRIDDQDDFYEQLILYNQYIDPYPKIDLSDVENNHLRAMKQGTALGKNSSFVASTLHAFHDEMNEYQKIMNQFK
jgi:hypothetical protein